MLYGDLTEKIIENLNKIHEVQLVNYLKAVNKEVGILLNFQLNPV